MGCHPSHWRTHIFQDGWNHQPVRSYSRLYNYHKLFRNDDHMIIASIFSDNSFIPSFMINETIVNDHSLAIQLSILYGSNWRLSSKLWSLNKHKLSNYMIILLSSNMSNPPQLWDYLGKFKSFPLDHHQVQYVARVFFGYILVIFLVLFGDIYIWEHMPTVWESPAIINCAPARILSHVYPIVNSCGVRCSIPSKIWVMVGL